MVWIVQLARSAKRTLDRAPARDRARLIEALAAMADNPFGGDIGRLKNQPATFRRRVGAFRIFFDVDPDRQVVAVVDIRRRTSATY
ncbi:hypothetical protein A3D66_00040 [Candidatus Kaiserbacteria bacterium RIFCSPHIGHO2_02_FULL_50_9]|uniref:Plasmid stabilization protein n=1 Tax=Candidatus Kaiserbacteria bacterium RIFCSPLOWO2_01_FULL_51_21 TaxID=1798508 RepID=A0A1F6EEJ8_9BACT|nr:MAG: hypothetical protein A2761_00275 [Candidatus Kaiserbacteria bacterium RIFCSPHIGHO2_01_FULL_51_33]OGG63704.1 MAG: hypothetical protein A3D66_00040 [Candidatus Kaiserbacteria bacterium RIFCSPHIGHO2_02_FULL_50_9]OGG72060.1 MAG: hypothetical protein A3A35_00910 [Candidatus Kaiserbacteria bacterium RIFCSPLOWO2_01_FULL_51_21]